MFFRVSGDSQHVIVLSAGDKIAQVAKDCAQQANVISGRFERIEPKILS